MTELTPPTAKQAYDLAMGALDWLEANPHRHIAVQMASTEFRYPVMWPTQPDAACFCAAGRILHDSGLPASRFLDDAGIPNAHAATRFLLTNLHLSDETITDANDNTLGKDRGAGSGTKNWWHGGENRGTIAKLRDIFDVAYRRTQGQAA